MVQSSLLVKSSILLAIISLFKLFDKKVVVNQKEGDPRVKGEEITDYELLKEKVHHLIVFIHVAFKEFVTLK